MPALRAARQANPEEPIFFRCDTHWRPLGALAAMRALATTVEQLPQARALPARLPAELGGRSAAPAAGDLVAALGLCTIERPGPGGWLVTSPLSLTSWGLSEVRERFLVLLKEGKASMPALVDDPGCGVLHLGTSFAGQNGGAALALALGRPLRLVAEPGATGLPAIARVGEELRRGTAAKVVVFEIVERGVLVADWDDADL